MYRPHSLFERPHQANDELEWFATDTYEEWQKNKNRPDMDPEFYSGKKLTYKFNSMGYRIPVDFDQFEEDFTIAMGCSYTEGVGNHEENTWPALLAKEINMPCYNFGISGSGTPIHLYNTFQWIRNNFPLPKVVIFQLPEATRIPEVMIVPDKLKVHPDMNSTIMLKPSTDAGGLRDPQVLQDAAEFVDVTKGQTPIITDWWVSSQQANIMQMLWNNVGVPVVMTTFSNDGDRVWNWHDVVEVTGEIGSTYGRDMSHQGPSTNRWMATNLAPRVLQALKWDGKGEQPFMRDNLDVISTSFTEYRDKMEVTYSRAHKPFIYE